MGYGTHELIKIGAQKAFGIVNDKNAIKHANKKYTAKNVTFKVGDVTKLPFPDGTFDAIVSFEVIEHIKNYNKYLREALRVLKRGGYFIFSTPNLKGHRARTSPYHIKEFSKDDLIRIFSEFNMSLDLYGQFYSNKKFLKEESEYFKRYNKFTLGGNNIVKKLLHLVPSSTKVRIYKAFWPEIPQLKTSEIVIKKSNLNNSVTLIGVARK